MKPEMPEKYSAEEWKYLCERFSKSILKTTEVAELGRNVGISWPFKGSDETPEKYISFSFEELQSVPGLIGKKKRVKTLMDVLREILAFDDPFSDMMDTVEKKNTEDRIYHRVLKKLGISEDYPINLMLFSSDTKELLHKNGIKTLIEAINFGKRSPIKAENDNDLNSLINGLALINEATIRKHLPFRIGQNGLHLPEAVGLLVRDVDKPVQIELLIQAGIPLTDSETSTKETANHTSLETALKVVSVRFNELCSWFSDEVDNLKQLCDSPQSVERYFLPINDAGIERVSIALAMINFGDLKKNKGNMINKISGLFKR